MTATNPNATRYQTVALSLSGHELDELDGFLNANAESANIGAADVLHGFLTAVALTPADLASNAWLPYVWSGDQDDGPAFASASQAERLTDYALRMFEDIVEILSDSERSFAPLVALLENAGGQPYGDARGWCHGFVQGILLLHEHWEHFLATSAGRCLVLPIFLLGADVAPPGWRVLTATARQRAKLSEWVMVAVEAIGTQLFMIELAAQVRGAADAGKLCPCRSGKPFRLCCGASHRLH